MCADRFFIDESAPGTAGRKCKTLFCAQFAIDGTADVTVTPEPSSLILLGSGILGVAGMVRHHLA